MIQPNAGSVSSFRSLDPKSHRSALGGEIGVTESWEAPEFWEVHEGFIRWCVSPY